MRLALVTRAAADAAAGRVVVLRELPVATVVLGCLQDHLAHVLEWIEIWIQKVGPDESAEDAPTNAQRDAQWQRLIRAVRDLDPDCYISNPFESSPPLPIYLGAKGEAVVHPRDLASDTPFELCRDDQRLQAADLPAYSASYHRYLHVANQSEKFAFVPITSGAPENARTVPAEQAFAGADLVPVNPAAALILLRRFVPLGIEDYADLIVGKPWRGVENSRTAIHLDGAYRTLQDESTIRCGGAHLFGSSTDRSGRYAEALHLKLQIVDQACRLVRDQIQHTQLPMLNLTADSFRVRLFPVATGLPLLWSSKLTLVQPGQGIALPIANTSTRMFRTIGELPDSVYRPNTFSRGTKGVASVRIRKVLPAVEQGTVIEGTFATQERLYPARNDLVIFKLPLSGGPTTLNGYLDPGEKLPQGELRFRTIPQTLSMPLEARLRAVEGVPFNHVEFEISPPASSPRDLYSLGVLALRILLVNPNLALPKAVDAMLSLARQLANDFDETRPIGERVSEVLAGDERWRDELGPQNLLHDQSSAEDTEKFLPPKLWADVLGLFVRFFPGIGPDSFCRDFGDAHSLALENIFTEPLHQLDQLCLRSRSFLLLNWKQQLEIAQVIQSIEETLL